MHNLRWPNPTFVALCQDGCNPISCLDREIQPIVRNPVVQPTCTFWAHGAKSSSNLFTSEHRGSMTAGGSEPVPPLVATVFCLVLLPHLGSQEQRCAWAGPVSHSVVESHTNLRLFVGLLQEGMSSCRTPRKGPTAPHFKFIPCFPEPCETPFSGRAQHR